jgi:hypothetical protein
VIEVFAVAEMFAVKAIAKVYTCKWIGLFFDEFIC